eukprot:TRINITY_DN3697_c0_g1_i1.p1 TRINITY_DN3697_c0_g1~~TRINITY_DN3697_c0_g1_i1.p1  ORF type:complete len:152 (+),score=27.05 TRINITY_DN3697_c0_g1_i1:81-536(+)
MRSLVIVSLLLAIGHVSADDKAKPTEKCEDFFEEVECTTCDLIEKEKPELSELITLCRKCCSGVTEAAQKFDSATFQLDAKHKMWQPEIASFIDDHAPSFKKLKITYESYSRPTLIMKRKDKNNKTVSEKITISSWKSHQIADYLKDRLSQ